MSFKLFIDCKKAGHVCDKVQYDESTLAEKIRLRIHILICGSCKKHSEKNVKLTKLCKEAKFQKMPEDKKQSLHRLINEELSK